MTPTTATKACAAVLSLATASSLVLGNIDGRDFYLLRSDGQLYSGQFGKNQSTLVGDTMLGGFTPGSGNGTAFGLANDSNGTLYGVGGRPGAPLDFRVARIDRNTAASTTVYESDAFQVLGMALDSGGNAFVYENDIGVPPVLTRFDPGNGNVIESTMLDAADPGLGSFVVRNDGTLVALSFGGNTGNDLYTLDPLTGEIAFLGGGPDGRLRGFARFGNRGYIGVQDVNGGAFDVYSVDLFSGAFEFEASILGEHQTAGSIFGFAIVPSPTPLMACALTAGFVARRRRR